MPQFETTFFIGQIFWFFISFGFLYLMMAGVICPLLEEVSSERQEFIQSELKKAEQFNRQAEIIHQRQQLFMVSVEQEKADRLQKALAEAKEKSRKAEARNEAALRRQVQQTERKIEALKKQMKTGKVVDETSDKLVQRIVIGWRKA